MITTSSTKAAMKLKGIATQGERMRMDGTDSKFGDWRDDLARDGYAVVKGAIPQAKALEYADRMYSWLEGLLVLL